MAMTSDVAAGAGQGEGGRICPNCGALDPVSANQPLWRADWSCPGCRFAPEVRDGLPLFAPTRSGTKTGMDPESFRQLVAPEESHFWFQSRNRLLTGLADKYCRGARSFLEVGCGNGIVLKAMAALRRWDRIAGGEMHAVALANARLRVGPNVELAQMDARRIPARGMFDLAGAFDVLEHVEEDWVVLDQMRAALRPHGCILVAVPQHPFLWSQTDAAAMHVRRYRRGEMEDGMVKAGFKVLFSTSFVSLLLPAMLASRLLRGNRADAVRVADSEFDVSPRINGVLRAICDLEVGWSLKGVAWPAGGSRIVVGQRND